MENSRRIRMTGSDSDFLHFATRSWSRPDSKIEHGLAICKRTGRITCECEDASFRRERRFAFLTDPNAETGCKHIRKLAADCARIIERETAAA